MAKKSLLVTFSIIFIALHNIYTAAKVKHHLNIFSVTVFMYDFLQKNTKFVKHCYPSISLSECHLILLLKFYGALYTPTPILRVYPKLL